MTRALLCCLLAALWLAACGADDARPAATAQPDADPDTPDLTEPDLPAPDLSSPDLDRDDAGDDVEDIPDLAPALDPSCEVAQAPLPEGLTVLQWDDGQGVGTVPDQGWSVVGLPLAEQRFYEATRFELAHPARVHAVSVQLGALPADPNAPITLGLYADFGYNGFDFWRFEPLWTGQRCAGLIQPGQWVTFTLPEPVQIDHPGLIYAAHLYEGPGSGALLLDGSSPPDCAQGQDCCAPFDACHSAWNLPDLTEVTFNGQPIYAWNGLSLALQFDYMARLHVQYLPDAHPQGPLFEPIDGPSPADRSAWGDYDNDGDDDLLTSGPTLYRNDAGALVDVTLDSGLRAQGASGGGVWGDYDNDGCLDLFIFNPSPASGDALLHNNCNGTFTDVTAQSGLDDLHPERPCAPEQAHSPSHAAAWWDLDHDGLLDLYVANYECGQDFSPDEVWHNQGGGRFVPLAGERGFYGERPRSAGRGAAPIDADQDGDVDLFVNNYRLGANTYYQNDGEGGFTPAQDAVNLAGKRTARGLTRYWGHSIGAAWGDLNGDGRFDLVVANLAHPRFFDFSDKTQVLLAQPDGAWQDIQGDWSQPAGAAGLRYQETHSIPALGDFDQDGALDLIISAVYPGRPTDFYWGRGDGTFALDSYRAGIEVKNGWGMASADLDLDGDLDLAATGALLRNRRAPSGRWLQVRVVGDAGSNRAGIGATVRVTAGGRALLRHVSGGTGQGCQDSLTLHFGLGGADTVDQIEVRFPGAAPQVFEGPFAADQRLWIYQHGEVTPGWTGSP